MENVTTQGENLQEKAPAPLGWQFTENATLEISEQEYQILTSVVAPYQAPPSLLNKQAVDGKITLQWQEYIGLMNVSKPFEMAIAIANIVRDRAIQEHKLLPFFKNDVEDVIEDGKVVGQKLKDSFGKKAVKEDNSLTLEDVKN